MITLLLYSRRRPRLRGVRRGGAPKQTDEKNGFKTTSGHGPTVTTVGQPAVHVESCAVEVVELKQPTEILIRTLQPQECSACATINADNA